MSAYKQLLLSLPQFCLIPAARKARKLPTWQQGLPHPGAAQIQRCIDHGINENPQIPFQTHYPTYRPEKSWTWGPGSLAGAPHHTLRATFCRQWFPAALRLSACAPRSALPLSICERIWLNCSSTEQAGYKTKVALLPFLSVTGHITQKSIAQPCAQCHNHQ